MNRLLKNKLLILTIIAFLTYLPSFWNKFVWDDEQFIYKNVYVKNFDVAKIFTTNTIAGVGENSNYYRPLTTLSFALDHAVWGFHPFGFHLTNTLLHIGAGLFLYLLLKELRIDNTDCCVNANQNNHKQFDLAFWISLFFLIHPIQTEAVVYVNSRGDSFYSFFVLLGLLSFAKSFNFKQKKIQVYNRQLKINKTFLAFTSAICFISAVLAKEIALASLGLFFLIFIFKLYRNHFKRQTSLKTVKTTKNKTKLTKIFWTQFFTLLSILGIAIFYLYLRATSLNFSNSFNFYDGENIYTANLLIRLLTFSKIFFTYLALLIIPYPLHMERNSEIISNWLSVWPISFMLVLLILIFLTVWFIYQIFNFHNTKPQKINLAKLNNVSWIIFGSAWFFIMLVPVSGIVPINGLIYEHWLYMPMIGLFIVLFTLVRIIFNKNQSSKAQTEILEINTILIIICSIYITLTIRQNYLWANPIRFYEYTLQYTKSARLYNNLGMAYANVGNLKKAIMNYQQSLQIANQYPQIYHNLGNAYKTIGELNTAISYYEQALQLNPNFHFSYQSLIELYLATNQDDKANQLLEKIQFGFNGKK